MALCTFCCCFGEKMNWACGTSQTHILHTHAHMDDTPLKIEFLYSIQEPAKVFLYIHNLWFKHCSYDDISRVDVHIVANDEFSVKLDMYVDTKRYDIYDALRDKNKRKDVWTVKNIGKGVMRYVQFAQSECEDDMTLLMRQYDKDRFDVRISCEGTILRLKIFKCVDEKVFWATDAVSAKIGALSDREDSVTFGLSPVWNEQCERWDGCVAYTASCMQTALQRIFKLDASWSLKEVTWGEMHAMKTKYDRLAKAAVASIPFHLPDLVLCEIYGRLAPTWVQEMEKVAVSVTASKTWRGAISSQAAWIVRDRYAASYDEIPDWYWVMDDDEIREEIAATVV